MADRGLVDFTRSRPVADSTEILDDVDLAVEGRVDGTEVSLTADFGRSTDGTFKPVLDDRTADMGLRPCGVEVRSGRGDVSN